MRLTLRTLLAYTDDILEPDDHEDLGRKIEASDFATELIHRSRDVVRRLRLGAPEVLASGGDDVLDSIDVADANAVAEYLDNTLSPDDVAEFERMCLEPGNDADMHLAEVASCHHVLTMVLGEPADIDLDVRHRMYDLPEKIGSGQKLRIEPAHVAAPQAAPPAPAEEIVAIAASQVTESVSEVPDYLRVATASRKRGKFLMVAAALLIMAGIAGFLVIGNPEEAGLPDEVAAADLDSAIADLEIGQSEEPISEVPLHKDKDMVGDDSEVVVVAAGKEVGPVEPPAEGLVAEVVTEDTPEEQPEEIVEPADREPLNLDSKFPEVAAEPEDSEPNNPLTITTEPPKAELPAKPSTELPAKSPETASEEAEMETPRETNDKPLLVASTEGTPDSDALQGAEEAVENQEPVQLGSYLGNNDVLLRYSEAKDKWVRMPPRSKVLTGSYLLALPKFRIHVVLADVNAYLSGGTRIELPLRETAVEVSDLGLVLDYGRVLLNAGLKGSLVSMQIGEEVRRIQMAGSASLAVEVQRIFVPGSNNELESSPVEATWYLTSGIVDVLVESGESQTIQAPAMWTTIGGVDDQPQAIEELPAWIDRESMTDLQRRARLTLVEELVPGEPVGIRLLELNDPQGKGRRSEVRTLAAEAGVHVGQFEPFVKALSDKDQRRAWGSHIKTLRQALALSPDVAANVHNAFIELRGEQAAMDLMEMVSGYNEASIGKTVEAVQEGVIAALVRRLESDSLDYRVLAIYNLDEIFGTTSLKSFRAVDSAQRRKIAVAKIWASLQSGELLPKP